MIPISVLDLVPVREGHSVHDALYDSAEAAKVAEAAGYKRYWIAEHHGTDGIAGGATSVVLAHIGNATSTIRIGAGGIMLPNHNPFVIAEQFGTLDALFPGRVDLGLGRAPGADGRLAYALRKDLMRAAEMFPQDVIELRDRFADDPGIQLRSNPGPGADVEMWILGSSLFGAQLAAHLGLPYAFASHFAPAMLDQALATYRENFRPSEALKEPRIMAAITAVCADSDEEAANLSTSLDQAFIALRSGRPWKLKPPAPGYRETLPPDARAMLEQFRAISAVGTTDTVRREMEAFAERTQADELIISASIFDQEARRRSLALIMEALSASKRFGTRQADDAVGS